MGWNVDDVVAYRTVAVEVDEQWCQRWLGFVDPARGALLGEAPAIVDQQRILLGVTGNRKQVTLVRAGAEIDHASDEKVEITFPVDVTRGRRAGGSSRKSCKSPKSFEFIAFWSVSDQE